VVVDSTELPDAGRLRRHAVSSNKLILISMNLRKNRENSKNTSKTDPQAVPYKVDGRVVDRRRPASFGETRHEKSLKAYKKE
jgi:hypothetical protein